MLQNRIEALDEDIVIMLTKVNSGPATYLHKNMLIKVAISTERVNIVISTARLAELGPS